MQSDERIATALRALARPIAEFRAALAGAVTQARTWLDAASIDAPGRTARAARELGEFAAGRIDPVRFGESFAAAPAATPQDRARVERALSVLDAVLAEGDDAFVVTVQTGESLARAVEDALSRIGRAFGAMMVAELVRSRRYVPTEHDALLYTFAFRAWTRDERRFAPPLVVSVDGSDLQVGGLADFTDGRVKIVLVVRGACAPAPLVRLITPGTLVLQTVDETGLDRVATADGPAIAAMVPDGSALFLHDPSAGREPWQRISVWGEARSPVKALGGTSAWHMAEDLRQLGALATAPVAGPAATLNGPATTPDTTERLARWLLGQADVA
jgi:hypothetical protein